MIKLLELYCDGSATTAGNPGGWGFVALADGLEIRRASGSLQSATNNVAELEAAINALSFASGLKISSSQVDRSTGGGISEQGDSPCIGDETKIVLVSDSQLTLRYATGEYQCKKYHLVPYYIKLRKLYGDLQATTRWVKGHTGDTYNEICDKLAKTARDHAINERAAQASENKSTQGSIES